MEPETVDVTEATEASRIKSRRVADDGTLTVYSKRSERRRRKQQLKCPKPLDSNLTLLDLPFDIFIQILTLLCPSDNFRLSRTCRSLYTFILEEHPARIAGSIVRWRYPCLEKCLRLPVPMYEIKQEYRDALLDEEVLKELDFRKRPYQHIKSLDPTSVCRCLTCVLRWNVLCLAVDFAHWQDVLDAQEALPVIPRGKQPDWNIRLLDAHAAVVEKALLRPVTRHPGSPLLWHAVILEAHLDSTVRSIRRHRANKFNRRPHYVMTDEDALSGTDTFLHKKGPPSVDFPFHRDNYYMLEAYLPNRSWFSEEGRWGYMPAEQHEKDIEQIRRWAVWRRELLLKKDDDPHQHGTHRNSKKTWTMQFNGSDWKPTLVIDGGRDTTTKIDPPSVETARQG